MTEATTRRQLLVDAAITTLARRGMRGLTHRAVDHQAGVPEGSTSYYFRTRQALLQAVVERVAELDGADLAARSAAATAAGPADLAYAAAELIEHWTTAGRERMLARYELALEANRRPQLREVFRAEGASLRALAAAILAAAGSADPHRQAAHLVAYLDGLIFEHLAGAGTLDLSRDEIRAALRQLLPAFVQA